VSSVAIIFWWLKNQDWVFYFWKLNFWLILTRKHL
jgi:hypothetical protein